jgi:HD-like signal output (HDOD) protein/ActR/RegA family two-component response regulator
MKRILFVDDESNMLMALRRMLRGMRQEWDMRFVTGGQEALAALEECAFDMIVTDMRMPNMDGAELLDQARRRFPRVARIVLSGYSDQEMILRAIPSTHQFLAKPSDAEAVKDAIARSLALHDMLAGDGLREAFYRLDALPCLAEAHGRLVELLKDPSATPEQVGRVVSQDVGMSAKILQLVNMPFFGVCNRVPNASQAVTMLGLDTLRALTLDLGLFSTHLDETHDARAQREFQVHCLTVAHAARRIVGEMTGDLVMIDHAFTGGMLHDLGRLALAASMPRLENETLNFAQAAGLPMCRVEEDWLGSSNRAEIGACLSSLWGLPQPITDVLAYHRLPSRHPGGGFPALTAVHVADNLDCAVIGEQTRMHGDLDMEYLETRGLIGRLEHWREDCERVHARLMENPAAFVEDKASAGSTASGTRKNKGVFPWN